MRHDLDERYLGNLARREGRQVDLQVVGIEADRNVEGEAGGDEGAVRRNRAGQERHDAGRRIAGEVEALITPDRHPHRAGDRLAIGRP
jgi:hypothetical protein